MSENQLGVSRPGSLLHRMIDSDIFYSFRQSPIVILSAIVTAVYFLATSFAP